MNYKVSTYSKGKISAGLQIEDTSCLKKHTNKNIKLVDNGLAILVSEEPAMKQFLSVAFDICPVEDKIKSSSFNKKNENIPMSVLLLDGYGDLTIASQQNCLIFVYKSKEETMYAFHRVNEGESIHKEFLSLEKGDEILVCSKEVNEFISEERIKAHLMFNHSEYDILKDIPNAKKKNLFIYKVEVQK